VNVMPTNAVANRNTTDVVNKFVIDRPILPSACSGCLVDWAHDVQSKSGYELVATRFAEQIGIRVSEWND
jgi:hypothetical protein